MHVSLGALSALTADQIILVQAGLEWIKTKADCLGLILIKSINFSSMSQQVDHSENVSSAFGLFDLRGDFSVTKNGLNRVSNLKAHGPNLALVNSLSGPTLILLNMKYLNGFSFQHCI